MNVLWPNTTRFLQYTDQRSGGISINQWSHSRVSTGKQLSKKLNKFIILENLFLYFLTSQANLWDFITQLIILTCKMIQLSWIKPTILEKEIQGSRKLANADALLLWRDPLAEEQILLSMMTQFSKWEITEAFMLFKLSFRLRSQNRHNFRVEQQDRVTLELSALLSTNPIYNFYKSKKYLLQISRRHSTRQGCRNNKNSRRVL